MLYYIKFDGYERTTEKMSEIVVLCRCQACLEIDGVKVDADNDLSELIQSYQPGKEIELTILRGKNKEKIKVKLGGG